MFTKASVSSINIQYVECNGKKYLFNGDGERHIPVKEFSEKPSWWILCHTDLEFERCINKLNGLGIEINNFNFINNYYRCQTKSTGAKKLDFVFYIIKGEKWLGVLSKSPNLSKAGFEMMEIQYLEVSSKSQAIGYIQEILQHGIGIYNLKELETKLGAIKMPKLKKHHVKYSDMSEADIEEKLTYLVKKFLYFNHKFFGGKLKTPHIRLLKNLSEPRCYGHWNTYNRELAFIPKIFNTTEKNFDELMLHEICHQAVAEIDGITRKDKGFRPHGEEWAAWMRKCGLDPKRLMDADTAKTFRSKEEKLEEANRYKGKKPLDKKNAKVGKKVQFYHPYNKTWMKGVINEYKGNDKYSVGRTDELTGKPFIVETTHKGIRLTVPQSFTVHISLLFEA